MERYFVGRECLLARWNGRAPYRIAIGRQVQPDIHVRPALPRHLVTMVAVPITVRVQEHVLRARWHRHGKIAKSNHEQERPEGHHRFVMADGWMWHRAFASR